MKENMLKVHIYKILLGISLSLNFNNCFSAAVIVTRDDESNSNSGPPGLLAESYGWAEAQGRRPDMQDSFDAYINEDYAYFGVYDGHGSDGKKVSEYVAANLRKQIVSDPEFKTNPKNTIIEAFKQLDSKILHEKKIDAQLSGTTAVAAIFIGDKLFLANTGDSRAVLSRNQIAIPLSTDHKPNNELKRLKIILENAKLNKSIKVEVDEKRNRIKYKTENRGLISIGFSRAIGDHYYMVTLGKITIPDPDIEEININPQGQIDIEKTIIDNVKALPNDIARVISTYAYEPADFLILACDGIWDVLKNQEAVDIVREALLSNSNNYAKAAETLRDAAFDMGSADNLTVIVINVQDIAELIQEKKVSKGEIKAPIPESTPKAPVKSSVGSTPTAQKAASKTTESKTVSAKAQQAKTTAPSVSTPSLSSKIPAKAGSHTEEAVSKAGRTIPVVEVKPAVVPPIPLTSKAARSPISRKSRRPSLPPARSIYESDARKMVEIHAKIKNLDSLENLKKQFENMPAIVREIDMHIQKIIAEKAGPST